MSFSQSAFATPQVLFGATRAASGRTHCICMKTKKNSSKEKRPAKGKRASSNGVGFGEGAVKTKSASDSTSPEAEKVKLEDVSGASGDATPHRGSVPVPTFSELRDPQKEDALDAPTEPLVELPRLTLEQKQSFRFDRRSSLDELIECFEDARRREDFVSVVVANRDLVTENLLYRFTSAILQVESRSTDQSTRDEEAHNMRQLRKELIAHCWSIDFPLKVGVQRAEARLLNVLKGNNISRDVERNCGSSALDVNAFWIVIFAAVAAWEERGRENPELVNVDMQKSLAAAADACQALDAVKQYLSPSLRAVQKILAASDPTIQTSVVADMSDDDVAELGSFTEQIRLMPTPAYGALVQRMRKIMDYVLADKYSMEPQRLEPFRFSLPEVERKSRLVVFAKTSENVRTRD